MRITQLRLLCDIETNEAHRGISRDRIIYTLLIPKRRSQRDSKRTPPRLFGARLLQVAARRPTGTAEHKYSQRSQNVSAGRCTVYTIFKGLTLDDSPGVCYRVFLSGFELCGIIHDDLRHLRTRVGMSSVRRL